MGKTLQFSVQIEASVLDRLNQGSFELLLTDSLGSSAVGKLSCVEIDVDEGTPPVEAQKAKVKCEPGVTGRSKAPKIARKSPIVKAPPQSPVVASTNIEETVRFVKTSEGQSICPVCRGFFASNALAMRHFKSVHAKMRYACEVCKTESSRKDNLKAHIMKKHEMSSDIAAIMADRAQGVPCS